jgi:hypothetical protein
MLMASIRTLDYQQATLEALTQLLNYFDALEEELSEAPHWVVIRVC